MKDQYNQDEIEELKKFRDKLFEEYISKLRERYKKLDKNKKISLISGIEKLLEGKKYEKKELYNPHNFDGKKAKEIRLEKNFKISDIIRSFNFREFNETTAKSAISQYENGHRTPNSNSRSQIVKGYIKWLNENGYKFP